MSLADNWRKLFQREERVQRPRGKHLDISEEHSVEASVQSEESATDTARKIK